MANIITLTPLEQRLLTTFRSTLSSLENAWKQVGLSPKEQAEEMEVLCKEVELVMSQKVETESALAGEYEKEVLRLKDDIAIVTRRLDATAKNVVVVEVPASEKQPLVRELTWLRGKWEKLDEQRLRLQTAAEEKLLQLHTIWSELGMKPEPGFEEVGFQLWNCGETFDSKLTQLAAMRAKRVVEVRTLANATLVLLEELEVDVSQREFDCAIASRDERVLGLSLDVVKALTERRAELSVEKDRRTATLQALALKIQPLWDRLGVLPSERQAFFERNAGIGENVVHSCEEELTRLLKLKRDRMADFISAIRVNLLGALDELRATASERGRLAPLLSQTVSLDDMQANEDLLKKHEEELQRLTEIVNELRPIVTAAQKYLVLCKKRTEYEKLISNSARLLDRKRGASTVKDEEILRKNVVVDLPKVVLLLETSIPTFENTYLGGARLCLSDVFGEDTPVGDIVQRNEKEHDENVAREKESKAKEKLGNNAVHNNNNNTAAVKRPAVPPPSAPPAATAKIPLGVSKLKN